MLYCALLNEHISSRGTTRGATLTLIDARQSFSLTMKRLAGSTFSRCVDFGALWLEFPLNFIYSNNRIITVISSNQLWRWQCQFSSFSAALSRCSVNSSFNYDLYSIWKAKAKGVGGQGRLGFPRQLRWNPSPRPLLEAHLHPGQKGSARCRQVV